MNEWGIRETIELIENDANIVPDEIMYLQDINASSDFWKLGEFDELVQ